YRALEEVARAGRQRDELNKGHYDPGGSCGRAGYAKYPGHQPGPEAKVATRTDPDGIVVHHPRLRELVDEADAASLAIAYRPGTRSWRRSLQRGRVSAG